MEGTRSDIFYIFPLFSGKAGGGARSKKLKTCLSTYKSQLDIINGEIVRGGVVELWRGHVSC